MAQQVKFVVRMTRPDRKRVVIRRYFCDKFPEVKSIRQLAGFLTHRLFSDAERGGTGTFYTIEIRDGDKMRVVNLVKDGDHYFQA